MKRLLSISLMVIMVFVLSSCATTKKFAAPNTFTAFKDNTLVYVMAGPIYSVPFYQAVNYAIKHNIPKMVIEIWSPGGMAHEVLRIMGIIEEYRGKIIFETRNYSMAWSGGFIVLISGDIGSRFIAKNISLMWHQTLKVRVADNKEVKPDEATNLYSKIFNKYIVSRSVISMDELLEKIDGRDWFLTSEEAIRYGFADGYILRVK